MKWQVAELMGYAHFAEKGYRIFVPLIGGEGYDFIASKSREMVRVNVKVAGLKDKSDPSSWSISKASGSSVKPTVKTECDVFLVYLTQVERFIELPGDFFQDSRSKSKRIPRELFLS